MALVGILAFLYHISNIFPSILNCTSQRAKRYKPYGTLERTKRQTLYSYISTSQKTSGDLWLVYTSCSRFSPLRVHHFRHFVLVTSLQRRCAGDALPVEPRFERVHLPRLAVWEIYVFLGQGIFFSVDAFHELALS